MPLVTTANLIADARRRSAGIGAFNAITLEHAEAIALAAERAGQPAIIQVSENAVRYHAGQLAGVAAGCVAVARNSSAQLALHLDHVTERALLEQSVDAGFSSAMYDASTLDYAANVAATTSAAQWAAGFGIWLEAELGEVGGKDGAHAPGVRTDPAEAAQFVQATGVNALAVAVGSSHAMATKTAALDLALISALRDAVPVPLVLHGSSGVPDEQLVAAVRAGIVKINIGTALNVAFTRAVREALRDEAIVDPRKYVAPARSAMTETVAHLLDVLGSA